MFSVMTSLNVISYHTPLATMLPYSHLADTGAAANMNDSSISANYEIFCAGAIVRWVMVELGSMSRTNRENSYDERGNEY